MMMNYFDKTKTRIYFKKSFFKQACIVLLVFIMNGCAATGKKSDRSSVSSTSSSSTAKDSSTDEDFYISNQLQTLTISRSNNRLTSRSYSESEAKKILREIGKPDDKKELIARMTAARLAGGHLKDVNNYAKKIVQLDLKKNKDKPIPSYVKLELAVAAVMTKQYNYAEYFLAELREHKNPKVRAAALTATGIIAADDGRLPEAVVLWEEAIKGVPSYEAARLNIGFYYLKYGSFAKAKEMLEPLKHDWFALYGLITAERLTGNAKQAAEYCDRLLSKKPRYKPALFNCALNAYQGEQNSEKALSYIDSLVKIAGFKDIEQKADHLRRIILSEKSKKQTKGQQKND